MNKLEEILQEHVTFGYADEQFLYDQKGLLEELSTLIQQERADTIDETIAVIEGYFKGLIAIPDPQKTMKSLVGYIYPLKNNVMTIEEYLESEK
jgi:hypothetical protein